MPFDFLHKQDFLEKIIRKSLEPFKKKNSLYTHKNVLKFFKKNLRLPFLRKFYSTHNNEISIKFNFQIQNFEKLIFQKKKIKYFLKIQICVF